MSVGGHRPRVVTSLRRATCGRGPGWATILGNQPQGWSYRGVHRLRKETGEGNCGLWFVVRGLWLVAVRMLAMTCGTWFVKVCTAALTVILLQLICSALMFSLLKQVRHEK